MSRKKKIITAVSTFSVALGFGFVMQHGDAVASRFQPDTGVAATASVAPLQDANVLAGLTPSLNPSQL